MINNLNFGIKNMVYPNIFDMGYTITTYFAFHIIDSRNHPQREVPQLVQMRQPS